ncbi:MAG: hypothetical protein RIS76_1066 [Verrucomicrobiota bacterium]|jgi:GTP-binding protein EngB required for normal cell division
MSESPLEKLLAWYQKHVKPFLLQHGPEQVAEYDGVSERLQRLQTTLNAKFPICFLGNSGIGKSTLINALVFGKEIYIPAGGVGPLTAQALTVCHGDHPCFQVLYHNTQRIHQVIFGLDKSYLAHLRREGAAASVAPAGDISLEFHGDDEVEHLKTFTDDNAPDRESKSDELRKQALLMVAGSQDAERDTPYLIDALLAAYGKSPRYGNGLMEEDLLRVQGIQLALHHGKANSIQEFRQGETPDFLDQLHHHATGYLAPLIRDLTVRWDKDILKEGLTLVDLPGVGISGDSKASVTVDYIRERAKGLVLVVSPRGIQQSDAELLRNSGFLNRLLHASDDPTADPVVLMIAVTRVDGVADDKYEQDRAKTKKRLDHFLDSCAEVHQLIRSQIRNELEKVWQTKTGLSSEKQKVIDDILTRLQVFPVSALQYRRFLADDMDNPWFIREAAQSNIPRMIDALQTLAHECITRQKEHLKEEQNRFFRGVRARLQVIRTQWENELHAADDAEGLRADLEAYITEKKLRHQFSTRQGEYREFLKKTLPLEIETVVTKAAVRAQEEVYSYMEALRAYPWNTLKAAVVRGGTYSGSRHIELPKDIALRFEEPIAEVWGKTLLKKIRVRTGDYAADSVELVEQILVWSREQGARVSTSMLEAQLEVIREDGKTLTSVGKEAIDELRKKVQVSLIKKIEGPIRRKCEKFVQEGQHQHAGVKARILDLFRKLSNESVQSATEPAIELLTERFKEVENEILAVFKQHQQHNDPITAAVDAIVATHEQRLEREDRKKKQAILQGLDLIVQSSPVAWADVPETDSA